MPKKNEELQIVNELKYEGLAALIIQGQNNAKERHDEFVKFAEVQFADLKAYNKKQNGSISDAIKDIAVLKAEANERKLTCAVAVAELQKKSVWLSGLAWVDKHFKVSIGITILAMIVIMAVIHTVAKFDVFLKIWLFLKEVV